MRKEFTDAKKPNVAVLETVTNANHGTIVVKTSYKDNDDLQKARWTDLIHDNWMVECQHASKDPKGLKYIVRDNIIEEITTDSKGVRLHTPDAIDEVFKRLKAATQKTLVIDAKSNDADIKASYQLLSAQTHVGRVLQWLKDYHSVLGDKKIGRLHLLHEKGVTKQYNIIIELA